MAQESKVNLMGGGGLMRFNEEYDSKFNIKPMHIIVFIVLIIAMRLALPLFF